MTFVSPSYAARKVAAVEESVQQEQAIAPEIPLDWRVPAPNPIRVGDRLELEAVLPPDLSGEAITQAELLPNPLYKPDTTLFTFGWDVQSVSENPKGTDRSVWVTLIPLKGGNLELPVLSLRDAEGKEVARTHQWNVDVVSAIDPKNAEAAKKADVQPPVALEFPLWAVVIAAVIAFLLIVLVIALIVLAIRKMNAPKPAPPMPVDNRTEDEIALAELMKLESEALWKTSKYKPHYFRASEILKAYIGRRYRFDALESTGREIIRALEERQIEARVLDKVESLFLRMDRVKFTDELPEDREPARILEEIRALVIDTRKPKTVMEQGKLEQKGAQ